MRYSSIGIAVAVTAAFAVVALGGAGEKIERKALERKEVTGGGEQLYVQMCASCHGSNATGDGPAAPALAMPVPDLTALAHRNGGEFPTKQVRESISGERKIVAHGTLDMPVWGQAIEDLHPDWKPARREAFARERIRTVASYLETLQRP